MKAKLVRESLINEISNEELEKFKKQINNMAYSETLSKWRFAPLGDPMFQGELGEYFIKVMAEKESKLISGEKTAISKNIGWKK